jgi:hypothetical protein
MEWGETGTVALRPDDPQALARPSFGAVPCAGQ